MGQQNAPANGIFSGKRLKVLRKKKTAGRVCVPLDRQKKAWHGRDVETRYQHFETLALEWVSGRVLFRIM